MWTTNSGRPWGRSAGRARRDRAPRYELCIVTERIAGETLAARLARGDRWTAAQAERLTRELLETLAYLHELSPPVVHRDVTPGNVMIDEDGRAMLVDFGAVRSLSHQPGQAQTVLGTPDYMAPEQAMGEATPASDLYGLGATLAHVLTHQHPSQLPREGLRISVEGLLGDAGAAARVLPGLLVPEVAERHASARAALAVLDGDEREPETRGAARSGWPRAGAGGARVRGGTGRRCGWRRRGEQALLREAEVMQALAVRRPTVENAASWTMKQLTSSLAVRQLARPGRHAILDGYGRDGGLRRLCCGVDLLSFRGWGVRGGGRRSRALWDDRRQRGRSATKAPASGAQDLARRRQRGDGPSHSTDGVGRAPRRADVDGERQGRQPGSRAIWRNDETVEVPLPPRLSAHQGALVAFLRDGSESVWVLSDTEVRELLDGETKRSPPDEFERRVPCDA